MKTKNQNHSKTSTLIHKQIPKSNNHQKNYLISKSKMILLHRSSSFLINKLNQNRKINDNKHLISKNKYNQRIKKQIKQNNKSFKIRINLNLLRKNSHNLVQLPSFLKKICKIQSNQQKNNKNQKKKNKKKSKIHKFQINKPIKINNLLLTILKIHHKKAKMKFQKIKWLVVQKNHNPN